MGIIVQSRRRGRRAGIPARAIELGVVARNSSFKPTQVSGNVLWLRADRGITLGTTPLASGTTPPAVTISGTLTQATPLYIQIDGAGGLGVATFKWSVNGGTTFVATGVLTAASVVLGTTGITAAFPSATYATDNIYKATVATWADQSGQGNDVANATASQQPLLTYNAFGGKLAVTFDGVTTWLSKTNVNFFGSGAYSINAVIKWDIVTGNRIAIGNSNAAGSAGVYLGSFSASERLVTHLGQFGAPDAGTTSNPENWLARRAAAAAPTLRVNGTGQSLTGAGAGLTDPGASAILHLGAGATGASNAPTKLAEVMMYTNSISDTDAVKLESYAKGRYGL